VRLERLRRRVPFRPDWMRRRPVVVPVIIGLNVVVYLAWQVAIQQGRPATGATALQRFMTENFMVSSAHLEAGRWWTLLLAEFSHLELWHIAINMFVLWSFGSLLERLWGRRLFTGFYLVAAVVASLSHCLVSSLLLGAGTTPAVGASGAVSGLLLAYALLFPKQKILLFGIIPLPALVAAGLFVGLDLWGLFAQTRGGGLPIGHGAHLGGALAGAVMWAAVLRPRFGRIVMPPTRPAPPPLSRDEAETIERIRRTLERDGVEGLTPKDRAFLDALRERSLGNR
jgi:membrane associated rhomboid family serine protease